MTPIGHSFKLLDSREGQRRWLVQLPKPAPMTEFQLPDNSTADASAESEAADDQAASEIVSKQIDSSSMNDREAKESSIKSSRCSYALANFDLDEVRSRVFQFHDKGESLGLCVVLVCQ